MTAAVALLLVALQNDRVITKVYDVRDLKRSDILKQVKASVMQDSWSKPNRRIQEVNNMLVVTQSYKVHKEVTELLQLLRQFK